MKDFASVLSEANLPATVSVGLEFVIPRTQNRIDVILSGQDSAGKDVCLIVELKQWSHVEVSGKDAVVSVQYGSGLRDHVHPSYQAYSYKTLLESFNEFVYQGGVTLKTCSFLDNMEDDTTIKSAAYQNLCANSPVFCKNDKKDLAKFLISEIHAGDVNQTLSKIDASRTLPSKALSDTVAGILKGKKEFELIDDQKLVFEAVKSLYQKAKISGQKQVLIVRGGPGTGKTVLAIQLLSEFLKKGANCRYVSRNSAPREVYKYKLTGSFTQHQIDNLFTGSGSFYDCQSDDYDVLLADEAHRLTDKSGMFSHLGVNQVKEIINAAQVSVFFLDENQRVTLRDIGSEQLITKFSKDFGIEPEAMDLQSQFRCDGDSEYLSWLDNTLAIRDTANMVLGKGYDFRVFDCPSKLRDSIFALNASGKTSRLVAGYCWPWITKTGTRKWQALTPAQRLDTFDIEFPGTDFRMRWNLSEQGQSWLIHPDSYKEIGCIHTCQGLEMEYVGVIIGPDLLVRDGEVQIHPNKHPGGDKALQTWRQLIAKDPVDGTKHVHDVIKNTYRVLMTRGLKGCFVYSADPETRDYFFKRLNDVLF